MEGKRPLSQRVWILRRKKARLAATVETGAGKLSLDVAEIKTGKKYNWHIMSFTVAIVGRPNVGKSTFFNRLLEQRKAIVDDTSGVTRDRQYGITDWNGKTF